MEKIAIVTVAYNRIDSLKRLLSSLEKAFYDRDVDLIISIDKSNTDKVELFADNYIWNYGKKIVDKHDVNFGLRKHMLSLGKWFDSYDALVVLEDDVVVAPSFYTYASQCVAKYKDNSNIAGISLYTFEVNYLNQTPFQPLKSAYDVYFMNCAMSWGEVWMKKQWNEFYAWYAEHQDYPQLQHIPERVCNMGPKSWLKYHTRYCIEQNKYFVYPYHSLSTNFSDVGTHNSNQTSVFQVALQQGLKKNWYMPTEIDEAICYDGFFENKAVSQIFPQYRNDVCVDINGLKRDYSINRYLLSTTGLNYQIVASYGLLLRPIENNAIENIPGSSIYLYDTKIRAVNTKTLTSTETYTYYQYRINSITTFLRRYGYRNLFLRLLSSITSRVKKQ